MKTTARTCGGPLAGITLLDLSGYLAAPYGCTLLADLGADVIKIEPPEGDNMRRYPSTLASESRTLLGGNRSKRGLVLDLKKPGGKEALLRLAKSADVLVHNFRPRVPPRLGITYDQLKEDNPRLIYCALSGYGESGPLKDKAGYDQVLQTMTGICVAQGHDVGRPELVYGSIVDVFASSLLAYGVLAALFHRERTGEGQYVGVSLLRTALAMQSHRMVWADGEGRDIQRDMRSGGVTGLHPTKDGTLYISANTTHFWEALCELAGIPELAADPRYDTIRKRAALADEIVPRIREALASRTALEWEALFGDRVPCAAARPLEDMFDHPQVLAQKLVADIAHPRIGSYRGFQDPVYLEKSPCRAPFAAPGLGEHTDEILAEFGFSAEEVSSLRESGVIEASFKS